MSQVFFTFNNLSALQSCRSCPWRLYHEDAVNVIGGSCFRWIWPDSLCSHQGYTKSKYTLLFCLLVFLLRCCIHVDWFKLQINDDEVELWVVKAITAKLLDCKMDQMNQVVIVRWALALCVCVWFGFDCSKTWFLYLGCLCMVHSQLIANAKFLIYYWLVVDVQPLYRACVWAASAANT